MGVWIEIHVSSDVAFSSKVAPLVGVWIEILMSIVIFGMVTTVAPLVGVWIEILSYNIDIYI